MKTLVVAEKPTVGRDIARVLQATQRGEGFLSGERYVVTWAVGHLVSLKEPDELDPRFSKWSMNDLPILPKDIPLKVIPSTAKQFDTVKKWMNSEEISEIICATDAGREGELIFRYIYIMAGCEKPVKRLWISSMTDAAIHAGFAAIKPSSEYDGLYASARCRSEADWLVGMNATRAFTLKYKCLLSAGRVQTPTLALIVQRDSEIASFKAEPYWELNAQFENWNGQWIDKETKSTRIASKERAEELAAKVKGRTGIVTECKSEERHVPAERLYDLTTLQREANRKYGFNAEKTLNLAQSLYETHKILTYPRTDSRFLPDDMAPKVIKTLNVLPEPYRSMINAVQPIKRADRIYDNEKISDHHAIIPTDKPADLSRLSEDEKKLFDLVARRLIANHYPEYIYNTQTLITGCEGENFKTSAVYVIQPGWKQLYKEEEKSSAGKKDAPEEIRVDSVAVGDQTQLRKTSIKENKTKPPSAYTDDTLLKAMQDAGKNLEDEDLREKMKDSGLGTPATRAAIIERLLTVGYAKRAKKNIVATEKGVKFISIVPAEMKSPETTGKWERYLAKLAREDNDREIANKQQKFLESIRKFSEFLVNEAKFSGNTVNFPQERTFPAKKQNNKGAKRT